MFSGCAVSVTQPNLGGIQSKETTGEVTTKSISMEKQSFRAESQMHVKVTSVRDYATAAGSQVPV